MAYVYTLLVVGVTKSLGGSWIAVLLGVLIVITSSWILPSDLPQNQAGNKVLVIFSAIRTLPWLTRFACGVLLVIGIAELDRHVDGFNLGRRFNVYLIPIFLSSLLLGPSVTFVLGIMCLLAVDYLVIPPFDSFAIDTMRDFVHLVIFSILVTTVFMIPQLLYRSSVLDQERRDRLRRIWF
jgi:K+-sensing histidine kinase KdpD